MPELKTKERPKALASSTGNINLLTALKEQKFHDQWAASIDLSTILVDESFDSCTTPENRQIVKWLGDIRHKRILDLGCGAGEAAVYFAKRGAKVTASDVSPKMLNVAQALANRHNTNIKTYQCPADQTSLPDQSFDIVYAANLIHHVNIDKTLAEIKRLLRPGGVAIFWDPLKHNPIINLYRRIAHRVRTEDEQPLNINDLKIFRAHFSSVKYECFWLFTLWIFVRFYLIEHINPNQERYWKKIIFEHKRLQPTYTFLARIDQKILGAVPFLKRYCWNIVIYCQK